MIEQKYDLVWIDVNNSLTKAIISINSSPTMWNFAIFYQQSGSLNQDCTVYFKITFIWNIYMKFIRIFFMWTTQAT